MSFVKKRIQIFVFCLVPAMAQWRMCSSTTFLTAQAQQGRTWWSERHRESRNLVNKPNDLFEISKAAFVSTTDSTGCHQLRHRSLSMRIKTATRLYLRIVSISDFDKYEAEVMEMLHDEQCSSASDDEWPVVNCYEVATKVVNKKSKVLMVYDLCNCVDFCNAIMLWFHLLMFCSCPGLRPQPAVPAALQALPGLKTVIINEFWHAARGPPADETPAGRSVPAYARQQLKSWKLFSFIIQKNI